MPEARDSPDRPVSAGNEVARLAALDRSGMLFSPAEERFDRITRLATRLFGVPVALISLVAEQLQWFKSVHGLTLCETPRAISFCGHAIQQSTPLIVEDALQDARFAGNPLVLGEPGIRFYAGHPICDEAGLPLGTLCLIDQQPRAFSLRDRSDLRDLAALVEGELQRCVLSEAQRQLLAEKDMLVRKASIDSLTRVWNRATVLELFSAELSRPTSEQPCAVAMLDVDHFKRVNDRLGHACGDTVLVEIAARIRRAVRECDIVGRFGGEEFIVVLAGAPLETARRVCERIRCEVVAQPIRHAGGELRISVSIGLAPVACGHEANACIAAADAALYRAKAAGRNCIMLAA